MGDAAELAIRVRRAAFNRAIVEGDAAAIGSVLARDCVMITGSDSAVISGRREQVQVWRREFASPRRLACTRTPTRFFMSKVEPIALEQGDWRGCIDGEATPAASGVYTAKWRLMDGQWVIEAEIFVTLA